MFCSVTEKEGVASAEPAKREESHKREINRDGEKEEKNKKLRKTDSKESIPLSIEKKPVSKKKILSQRATSFYLL